MAWARNDYIAGSAFDYNEANAIGDSIRTWQGSVNANGNNLSSLATLTMVGNGGVTLNKFSPIGYAGGVANTDASLVFYKNDANNWAGAGADQLFASFL